MKRRIIKINEEKCNGCGICAEACHEAAIGMKEGKAILLRDDYCDGLGDCLPTCPTEAISFEERDALPFDKEAVEANMRKTGKGHLLYKGSETDSGTESNQNMENNSALTHWPVQLQLVAENAAFLQGADLLISADCAAYAYGDFHQRFMKNKVTLVGCPKLDHTEYSKKIATLLGKNQISSVEVVRMEVPCCGGIEFAVKEACDSQNMDYSVVTLTTEGAIKSTEKTM